MSTPKFRMVRKVASVALALVLGTAVVGCGGSQQAAPAEDENAIHVTMSVIGPDESGEPTYYVPETEMAVADENTDAWALSQDLFALGELTYDAANSDYGIMLNSINSPYDGSTLAWDEATGCYWQLFVNGVASEVGISEVQIEDGMEIVWYYSAFGDTVPADVALPAAA